MNDKNDRERLERNKAVALRFKKSQGTKEMPQVEREVLAPNYDRMRGGSFHLAANARDQGWPHPGMYLRTSFPDRVDVIEGVVAEGERVALLFRINATHTGNYFGIVPAGRKLDVYECAFLRIVNGQMIEGWFMMDEAEKLRQLGAKLPARGDGRTIVPALPHLGEEVDVVVKRLESEAVDTHEQRNKLAVARALANTGDDAIASGPRPTRRVLEHLHDYAAKRNATGQTLRSALPDLRTRIEVLLAEGDQVWARCNFEGTHTAPLHGLAPSGKRVGIPFILIARFADGEWKERWEFGDELGLLLQLGQPNLLLDSR
ncbi:MAG: ester cyclase [Burkholderiales bacterium]